MRSVLTTFAKIIIGILCLTAITEILTGCAATMPVIAESPASQVVVKTVCPPIPTYTRAQEQALGAAVAALPVTSPLVSAMADYGAVRAAIRACRG